MDCWYEAPGVSHSMLPMTSATFRTGQLLYLAHRAARARANRALQSLGLDLRGLGVLSVLAEHGPLSQRRLSQALELDKSSMVLLVDALERGGLVVRARHPRDRRAYAVQLTPAGRERLAQAAERAAAALEALLAPLSPAEREQLDSLLTKLVAHARRLDAREPEPPPD